jgi:hypothetical protein
MKYDIIEDSKVRHDDYAGDAQKIQCAHSGISVTVNQAAKLGWTRRRIRLPDGREAYIFNSGIGSV